MVKGVKTILVCLGLGVSSCYFSSCQNISSTLFGNGRNGTSIDSLIADTIQAQTIQKPLLLDKWDSLQKNLIVFEVDSLKPVSIREQKRALKDSLKKEFDKQPKHVFLTFDDGPLVGSAALDSIATARKMKISTFLVGRHAKMGKDRQKDLAKYKENPYVTCYNHSYTHALNRFTVFYSNPASAFADFEKNETELGLQHKIVRLPGRNIWIYDDVRKIDLKSGSSTADLLHANGYNIYGWDVEWRIKSTTGEPIQPLNEVYNRMKDFMKSKYSMTPNNVVLLMHDDMFQTKKGQQLLVQLLDSLQKLDYKFEFMEDYPIKY